jgi:hypothetical protein
MVDLGCGGISRTPKTLPFGSDQRPSLQTSDGRGCMILPFAQKPKSQHCPRDFGGQVMSETLFVASDGKSVRVGYGDPGAQQPIRWSAPQPVASADIDRLLGEAIRRVADSYYSRP